MSYEVASIANYFIINQNKFSEPLTAMKLQKVIYIAQMVYLARNNSPLIKEDFCAWKCGPVIIDLYMAVKHFGKNKVTAELTSFSYKSGDVLSAQKINSPKNKKVLSFLNEIIELCSDLSTLCLSSFINQKGSPWHAVIKKFMDNKQEIPNNIFIKNTDIKKYFLDNIVAGKSNYE